MVMVQVYHVLHLLGIMMIFVGYGGLTARVMLDVDDRRLRRLGAITSGLGLFLVLLGGFGLLARLYDGQFLGWINVKIGVWVLLGALIFFINRFPKLGQFWWWLATLLGLVAVLMVYVRPL